MKNSTLTDKDILIICFRYAVQTATRVDETSGFVRSYAQFRRILADGYDIFEDFIAELHNNPSEYFTKVEYLHEIGADSSAIGLFDFCILANPDICIDFGKDFEKYVNNNNLP